MSGGPDAPAPVVRDRNSGRVCRDTAQCTRRSIPDPTENAGQILRPATDRDRTSGTAVRRTTTLSFQAPLVLRDDAFGLRRIGAAGKTFGTRPRSFCNVRRTHLVRYSGILARAAKLRALIVPTEAAERPGPMPHTVCARETVVTTEPLARGEAPGEASEEAPGAYRSR